MLPQVSTFTYACVCVCESTLQRGNVVVLPSLSFLLLFFIFSRLRSRPRLVFSGDLLLCPCCSSFDLFVGAVTLP